SVHLCRCCFADLRYLALSSHKAHGRIFTFDYSLTTSARESCYEDWRRYRRRTCVRTCGAKCNLLLERVKNDDEEKRESSLHDLGGGRAVRNPSSIRMKTWSRWKSFSS